MRTRGFAALTALMMLAAPLLAAEPPNWKVPDKNWVKGPVGWIMTEDEQKEFKKLRTDEERAAFAKTFWEKRDPTPGTPANEYEKLVMSVTDISVPSFTRSVAETGFGKMRENDHVSPGDFTERNCTRAGAGIVFRSLN